MVTNNNIKTHYVYELINQMGTVEYVGETVQPKRRFYQHTKNEPAPGIGKFYGRQDLSMHIVKTFDKKKDALLLEGELKLSYGMEWVEQIRGIKMGKTGLGGKATKEKYSQAIIAYDYKTGHYIGEYPSLMEASRMLTIIKGSKVNNGNISKVLNGNRNHTAGWTFTYKEDC